MDNLTVPQGLIRVVMPLLMVCAFLLYVLVNLPDTQTEPAAEPPEATSEAAE